MATEHIQSAHKDHEMCLKAQKKKTASERRVKNVLIKTLIIGFAVPL